MKIECRPLRKEDAPRMAELANNRNIWDHVRDFFPHPYQLQDALDFIDLMNQPGPDRVFGIHTEEGFCGAVGVHPLKDIYRYTAELGYWIGEPYWGLGIATSAVKWVVSDTWRKTDLQRLEAGVFDYNKASMRILEKCNFKKECIQKNRLMKNGKLYDEHLYAILRP